MEDEDLFSDNKIHQQGRYKTLRTIQGWKFYHMNKIIRSMI